ncbi:coiled-coil domain-containing 51 isoform X2 [Pelobates cultripes]|uniref:Coiled-coil domain-containing 51 isoform X2 n=1 Tax=Pelobates cultripes TaxID=61616 RepID=A0AAD1W2Q5_PELCU|nr:coiled-coil domain-containing 51 isoform X2 [Pelobates cultripes]
MPKCMVNGCRNRQRKSGEDFSLHSFPNTRDKIKSWLLATGDHFEDMDAVIQHIMQRKKATTFRICSDHFSPKSFSATPKKRFLKPGAVPTIFKKTPRVLSRLHEMTSASQDGISDTEMDNSHYGGTPESTSFESSNGAPRLIVSDHDYVADYCYVIPIASKFCNKETSCMMIETSDKSVSTVKYMGRRNVSTQTYCIADKKNSATSTIDLCKKRDAWTWTGIPEEMAPVAQESSTRKRSQRKSKDRGLKNQEVPASGSEEVMDITSSPTINQPCTYGEIQFMPVFTVSSLQINSGMGATVTDSGMNALTDLDSCAEKESTEFGELSFSAAPTPDDFIAEKKFIVFETCLDQLLRCVQTCKHAETCTAPIVVRDKIIKGTLLTVYTTCENNHRCLFWQSQPMIGKRSCGNILASASVLFSGSNFSKASELFRIFGVSFISEAMHFIYQKKFLFPVVDLHHEKERKAILAKLKGRALCLSGDGQFDSPGFGAKYCTYTLLEESTKKIIECNTIRVRETKSSVAMESKAFQKCIDQVREEGLKIAILATDRHANIRKIMKAQYKNIIHQFDVWRYCKRLRRKLESITRHRLYKELAPWNAMIINHMWTSCFLSKGNVEFLRERWKAVLHHIKNEHAWDNGTLIYKCDHQEIVESEERTHCWVDEKSQAYSKLGIFVRDKQIHRDLEYMAKFCHSDDLNIFHSLVFKYRPKQIRFTMDSVVARTKLAVLAHNANVDRKQTNVQKNVKEGTKQADGASSRPHFYKKGKNCQVKKIIEPATFDFIFPMVADVIRRALSEFEVTWVPQGFLLPSNIAAMPGPSTKAFDTISQLSV